MEARHERERVLGENSLGVGQALARYLHALNSASRHWVSSLLWRIDSGGYPQEGQGTRHLKCPKRGRCALVMHVPAASARTTIGLVVSYARDTRGRRGVGATFP
jgi:hypothetical protein